MAKQRPLVRPGKTAKPDDPLLEARASLERAENLRKSRHLAQARKICESILKRFPDYAAARHTLGLALADRHDYDGALPHLVRAVMLNPKSWSTQMVLAGVYVRLGSSEMAASTLEAARARKPDDPGILVTLGEIYRDSHEFELGADAFRQAWAADNSMHAAKYGLGLCCTHLGAFEEAAAAFETLVQHPPLTASLVYSLSQLPASLIKSDVLTLLDQAVREPGEELADFNRALKFAKAAALDTASQHSQAWQSLVEPNREIWAKNRKEHSEELEIQQVFLSATRKQPVKIKADLFENDDDPVSLFILGPSRSGKTTMERLVSLCEGVKRGYENQIIENTVRQTFQTANLPPRHRIVELPPVLDALYRETYLEELKERAGTARVFTNTLPGRIYGLMRIATVVPNVRFIFVKRDIEDITLRIFMREYKSGNSYGYDISNIREHVTWYYQMMDVLAERLPDITMAIRYEDMTADPATTLQSAARLCGLSAPAGKIPPLGDDRGCAEPYKALMDAALKE